MAILYRGKEILPGCNIYFESVTNILVLFWEPQVQESKGRSQSDSFDGVLLLVPSALGSASLEVLISKGGMRPIMDTAMTLIMWN